MPAAVHALWVSGWMGGFQGVTLSPQRLELMRYGDIAQKDRSSRVKRQGCVFAINLFGREILMSTVYGQAFSVIPAKSELPIPLRIANGDSESFW